MPVPSPSPTAEPTFRGVLIWNIQESRQGQIVEVPRAYTCCVISGIAAQEKLEGGPPRPRYQNAKQVLNARTLNVTAPAGLSCVKREGWLHALLRITINTTSTSLIILQIHAGTKIGKVNNVEQTLFFVNSLPIACLKLLPPSAQSKTEQLIHVPLSTLTQVKPNRA